MLAACRIGRGPHLSDEILGVWSPLWQVDEATFTRTAAAFQNPDFVEIVIRSYRHRSGLAASDQRLDAIEARLAGQPLITMPAIVLRGDRHGVDPASDVDDEAPFFTGSYERR